MSVEPEISASGELLYQRVLPLMGSDEEYGWFGRYLCGALMDGLLQGFDQVVLGSEIDGVVYGPWCVVAVPAVCPPAWLPWSSALYGVTLTPGSSVAVQRQTIEELPPQKRGGITAMAAAAAPELIGTGTAEAPQFNLTLIERPAGKAYKINGYVAPEPSTAQQAAIEAALLTQKAGGIKLTMSWNVVEWEEATLKYEETSETWAGATLAGVT
ncbi:MAG TPA: hypothetical protein VK756_07840 [Solirubrobacteraceae bacterium]|jgi:hypothetical protein|nr:hypothetical protein [Solirubrobacteraceae bacterium]